MMVARATDSIGASVSVSALVTILDTRSDGLVTLIPAASSVSPLARA